MNFFQLTRGARELATKNSSQGQQPTKQVQKESHGTLEWKRNLDGDWFDPPPEMTTRKNEKPCMNFMVVEGSPFDSFFEIKKHQKK